MMPFFDRLPSSVTAPAFAVAASRRQAAEEDRISEIFNIYSRFTRILCLSKYDISIRKDFRISRV
jgi:hypothetical protein